MSTLAGRRGGEQQLRGELPGRSRLAPWLHEADESGGVGERLAVSSCGSFGLTSICAALFRQLEVLQRIFTTPKRG
jgi:hypothetical protein